MNTRKVERIVSPGPTHFVGDGFKVHNIIPGPKGIGMQRMSPFILLDYNAPFYFGPTDSPRGVGVHPHRGFETVTLVYKGKVAHHDSTGARGVIAAGEVQWMTAASGVLHKEYHETEWSKKGGEFQVVQLWVNLPAKDKMSAPKYQNISASDIAHYPLNNGQGTIEIIAGSYKGIEGPAATFTPVYLFNAKLQAQATAQFSFPEHYNTAFLVLEGKLKIEGQSIEQNQFVLLENKGTDFEIEALEQSIVLVMSGAPILEPIAAHGPFVMNTKEEILQAFEDYNLGKFGYLEE